MYSKQESKNLKQQFWIAFAQKYPRKWLLYDTKIKDFSLKFFIDNKTAKVIIDIEDKIDKKRFTYFEKLVSLQLILEECFVKNLIFKRDFILENGKIISRIFVEKQNVTLYRKEDWNQIFEFFSTNMQMIEDFYSQYDTYIMDID